MNTKKFSFNKQEGKQAGVINPKTVAAGVAAAVGMAGGAAAAVLTGKEDENKNVEEPDVEQETAQQTVTAETHQETAEQAEASEATEQPTVTDESETASTQPGPTTGNGTQTGGQTDTPSSDSTEQVVAELLGEDEVDSNDIEEPAMVTMESFETIYDEDGNEYDAVLVHDPDGRQCVLIDADGDGTYDMQCSPDLAQIAPLPEGLVITHSDMENQLGAGGYMAFVGTESQPAATDVTADIIDTNTGGHVDVASNETTVAEEVDGAPTVAEEIDDDLDDDIIADIVMALLDNETDDGDEALVAQDVEDLLGDDLDDDGDLDELADNDEPDDFDDLDDYSDADGDLDDILEA